MASPLQHVPGLAGYLQQQQMAQQQETGQLQQFGQVMGLRNALAKQEALKQAQTQELAAREALRASGGDPVKASAVLLQGGHAEAAAKLAPLIQATKKPEPKEFAPPELVRLQDYLGSLPVGDPRRAPVEARIKMLGERQAGVTVNMPSSTDTFMGQDGKLYKFQVGKDGQTRAVPVQTASGEPLRPLPTAGDIKAGKEETQTIADIGEIERLGTEMDSLVQKHQGMFTGVVGPQAVVGRIRDIAAGALGAETPTIDFGNKAKLFLSSVRKMVEKDANLSNQERVSLLEAIGTGFWQTGGSSIRARQDVMNYVKKKRMAGLKPTTGYTQQDLEFTARKHGITVEEVKRRLSP